MRACVRVCVRAYVCVRASVRACVRASVGGWGRVCMWVQECERVCECVLPKLCRLSYRTMQLKTHVCICVIIKYSPGNTWTKIDTTHRCSPSSI